MSKRQPRTFAADDWQRLIESLVEQKHLIPVVGEELSCVTRHDGSIAAWPTMLAEELERDGVISEGDAPLDWPNDNRLRDSRFAGEVADANARLLRKVLDGELRHRTETPPLPSDLRLTEPLRLLASIKGFPLIATTAPDGLLLLALRIEADEHDAVVPDQPDWSRRIVPLHMRTNAQPAEADLPVPWQPAPGRCTPVYHLFGMLRFLPGECALRDSEQLEKIIHLAGARPHTGVLSEFGRCDVLILGTRLPDCLAAAFIRLLKGRACHESTTRNTIAGTESGRPVDPSLLGFLDSYSRTQIFNTGDAASFISEFHHRWSAALAAIPATTAAVIIDDQRQLPERCIFLSYASEDRAIAQRIYDHLIAHQLPVWFDRVRLEGAEPWNPQLQHAVRKCRIFLPLITPHSAQAPGVKGRFYLQEWTWAVERAPARTGTPYLFPISNKSIDPSGSTYMDQHFPRFHAEHGLTSVDALFTDEGLARLRAAYLKAEGTHRFLQGSTPLNPILVP